SSRAAPATQDTPDPKNLLEYGPNSGLPEDEGLRQAAAHDAERARQAAQNEQRPVPEYWPQGLPPTAEDWGLHQNPSPPDPPNPLPIDPSARTEADTQVAAAGTLANTEADPNQTTPVPKPNVPDAPPPPPLAPERRPYQAESDAVLASMIRNERAAASKAFAEQRQLGDRMRFLQQEIERSSKDTLLKAGHASGAGAAEGVAEELLERHVLHGPPQGRLPGGVTARSLTGAGLAGAVVSAGAATLHGRREVGELQAELESVVERLKAQFEVTQQIQRRRDELEAERTRRNGR
ncbi:MAG: hypothetical protein NBV67_15880, partial [Tagaea sp.]|nr:hypothetical protein [Tagaea sp.]